MPKVDPSTKKGWVRVLPDLPGHLKLREVDPQPTIKRACTPPTSLHKKRPSPDRPHSDEELNSRVREILPVHAEEAVPKTGRSFAALNPFRFLRKRHQSPGILKPDEQMDSYVPGHVEQTITKGGHTSPADPKSALHLNKIQPSTQAAHRDAEFNSYMRERLPSQGEGVISFAERPEQPHGRSDGMEAVASYSVVKPLIARGEEEQYFGTSSVQILNSDNFYDEVVRMEKAFVIFYDPNSEKNIWAGRQFAEASRRNRLSSHTYAAVDCSIHSDLCCREHATNRLPIFKLYSNGYYVSTSRHSSGLKADQMIMLVRMAPVLNQPRPNID